MLNIREIRQRQGYTQKEVCLTLNIPQNTFSQYENNKREPDTETLTRIADFFCVSVDDLLGRETPTPKYEKLINEGFEPYNPKLRKIPVLGYVAAGLPIYADEHIIDYTYTEIENDGFDYFALKIKGDSMNAARINDGDIVIVRVQSAVDNGDIAVVLVDNEEATVKEFNRVGDIVQLIPHSFNPAHKIQEYELQKTQIRVMGKVVKCEIKF